MQLTAALIFIGIALLLLLALVYFGKHQRPKSEHYDSWNNVLPGLRLNGQIMDINENLNKKFSAGRRLSRREQTRHRAKNK